MYCSALERRKDIGSRQLVLRIQPDEGISTRFNAKVPGTAFNVSQVRVEFDYDATLMNQILPAAMRH